jgi:hypothetical protein
LGVCVCFFFWIKLLNCGLVFFFFFYLFFMGFLLGCFCCVVVEVRR